MMEIMLGIFYLALFYLIFFRLPFIKNSGIKTTHLYLFFTVKIIAGFLLTDYYKNHYGNGDMFAYFEDAKIIHHGLKENIGTYFKLLTGIDSGNPELNGYYLQMTNSDYYFQEDTFIVNSFMIRLNALMLLFSFGYFHVHIIFMCALSFIGSIGLYRTFSTNISGVKKALLQIAIFLTPSLLVWSSVVLKEGVVVFSLGILTYCVYRLSLFPFSFKYTIVSAFALLILFCAKKYIAFAVTIPLLVLFFTNKFSFKKQALAFISIFALCILCVWFAIRIASTANPSLILLEQQQKAVRQAEGGIYLYSNSHVRVIPFDRFDMLTEVVKDSLYTINKGSSYKSLIIGDFQHESFIENSPHDSVSYRIYSRITPANYVLNLPLVSESPLGIITAIPQALYNVLFHPSLIQADAIPIMAAALENTFILLFILLCMCFTSVNKKNINLILFCATLSISLFILFGLTTPVTGTLVRYKSIVFPFLLTTAILLLNEDKLLNKLKRRAQ